jgi:hypothetical protein
MFSSYIVKPKDIQFESQSADETVHFLLRKHPITNLGWILSSILLVFFPLFLMVVFSSFNINTFKYIDADIQIMGLLIWYMLTMFMTFESFLIWYFNVYIITDKRLIDIDFSGLWRKRISETSLGQIEDATYQTHKFWHILFDYGDIEVQTAAEKTEFEFSSIPKPSIVHDKFTDLVEAFKKKNGNKY